MTLPKKTTDRRRVDESNARVMILSAASKIMRERGIGGLTIAGVLEEAELGTRVFYRIFSSKDELVQAVFMEMARVETLRLRRAMSQSVDPVHGVAAWIAGRLDLAFDPDIRSDLRAISREAQSQLSSAPQLISAAFNEMLAPLCEQLEEGRRRGVFPGVDPVKTAQLIHGALWACTESHWATGDSDRAATTSHALTFCLRGLGTSPTEADEVIQVVTGGRSAGERQR